MKFVIIYLILSCTACKLDIEVETDPVLVYFCVDGWLRDNGDYVYNDIGEAIPCNYVLADDR